CKTRQCDKMAGQPDMIIQFAHHLAEEKRREGYADVEVRATVLASMNGRKAQLLIDPEVDLAKVRRSMWPASWIVPLTEPLPAPGSEQPGEITDEE
ncbi:MAG TPA: HTTM domain-containing protein, partial [Pyrinomonadaceae bacterium]|nr:HTTM domain-containing protein [Pyrinomonadaceae bacterium]